MISVLSYILYLLIYIIGLFVLISELLLNKIRKPY